MRRLTFLIALSLWLAACAPRPVVEAPPPAPPVVEEPVAEEAAVPGLDAELLRQPLGLDPAVRTGTLENGLTYYVRRNAEPRARAELRLVVDAGSVLEEADQQGLAHLLEHMAFQGTEHFPEQALVNFLERIGMRFGPDLNAYTSFDETVYMLQVPTDDAATLRTGLDVLREWAGSITLDAAAIDQERGVVLEEWRQGRGAQARLRDEQFPVLFGGSRYAERLPIGDPEVIRTAPAERVRDFYRDWYRPDLMSVVAVGDFDPDEIESTIQTVFADLTNPPDAPERPTFAVPQHEETRFAIATDPELQVTTVTLLYKEPAERLTTVRDLREALIDGLYIQMLNQRLTEIARRPGAPFLGGGAFQSQFVRPADVYGLSAAVRDGGVPGALDALLTEAARVRLYGFTPGELDRAKANLLRAFRQQYEERDNTPSRAFAGEYVSHFLEGEAAPGIERELELAEIVIPTISLAEVDARAGAVTGEANRVVMVSAPEQEGVTTPGETELRGVLAAVEAKEIEPYVDAELDAPLVAAPPPPAPIRYESHYEDGTGVTEWVLANGARVVLRPTDFRNDEVLFTAFSPGGLSLVPDRLFRTAEHAAAAVQQGGLGPYSATDLSRYLAGTAVQVSPYVGSREEGLSGSASPQDLEELLQLVYLHFAEPRRDDEAFEAYRERVTAFLQNRSAAPTSAFADTLAVTLAQHHPRSRPLTVQDVQRVELDEALGIYRERFADASDFTFVFVGAFEPDSLAPLVKQYLAPLPGDPDTSEEARDLGIRPPAGVVERTVRRGLEPQARVQLAFSGDLRQRPEAFDPVAQPDRHVVARGEARRERYHLGALAEALRIRLREELREERGGVYGVSVSPEVDRLAGTYTFHIAFATDPERVDELIEAVFSEVARFQTQGPDADVITRVAEAGRRSEETNLRTNRYWMNALVAAYRYDESPAGYLYREDLRGELSPDLIQEAARRYLDRRRVVQVVLLPEAAAQRGG